MKTAENNLKRIISLMLAFLVLAVSFWALSLTVSARVDVSSLDYVPSLQDNACSKTDSHSALSDIPGGGVRYEVHRLGGYYPFAYNQNLGAFPGDGLMLQFSRYVSSSSSPTILGTGMFLVMLCKSVASDQYYKFKTGVCGVLIDTNIGEAQLVESTSAGMQSYDVKQVLIKSDILKQSNFYSRDFALYFRNIEGSNDILLTIKVDNSSASGAIDGDIFASIPHHPTAKTYVSFGSTDNNGAEWNTWTVDFYGAKHLRDTVSQGEHGKTYANGIVPATDKSIIYYGRWGKSGNAVTANFQSAFNVKFSGGGIAVACNKDLSVSVDGNNFEKYETDGKVVSIGGLRAGNHTLRCVVDRPGANAAVSGFYLEPGQTLYQAGQGDNVLFIGDNSTAGTVAGGAKSFSLSFAAKTAKRLDMDVTAVAVDGVTILSGEGSDALGMPARFYKQGEKGTNAQNESYDAKSLSPDCVVVNIGAYGTNGKTADAYGGFVTKLRASYPNAKIVCLEPFNSHNAGEIKQAVTACRNAGDKSVFYVASSGWGLKLGSDNASLTADSHKTAALKLSSAVSDILSGKTAVKGESASISKSTSAKTKAASSSKTKSKISGNMSQKDEPAVGEETVIEGAAVANGKSSVPVYLWVILAVVCAAVIAAVLITIFWPDIKKLLVKK